MTSRTDLDRPATVLSASLGVVLIAVSILLFVFTGAGGGNPYDVSWGEVSAAKSESKTFAGNGQSQQTAPVTTTGDLSNVTINMDSCSDTPAAGTGQPATIQWQLFKDGKQNATGTAACAPGKVTSIHLHDHPDVGQVKAGSPGDAQSDVWAGHTNATHTFYLVFSYSRPADTVPVPGLPAASSTFAGRMSLEVTKWVAAVNEQGAGVGK